MSLKTDVQLRIYSNRTVVFKLCAAALWGAVRNLRGAENFIRQYEIFKTFYQNLADFLIKCCSMLFIIKNMPIFYTNSLKASRLKGI